MASSELLALVDTLAAPAFDEPKVGATMWTFHTREIDRSLEPDEVVELMEAGTGVYVFELVWDEDFDLVQRGEGRALYRLEDLVELREGRFRHLVDPASVHAQNPALAMNAPKDNKPRTSTPWHPSLIKGE